MICKFIQQITAFFTGNFSGISAAREPEKQSSVQHTPGGTKPTSGDFWFTAVIFSSQKKEKKRLKMDGFHFFLP